MDDLDEVMRDVEIRPSPRGALDCGCTNPPRARGPTGAVLGCCVLIQAELQVHIEVRQPPQALRSQGPAVRRSVLNPTGCARPAGTHSVLDEVPLEKGLLTAEEVQRVAVEVRAQEEVEGLIEDRGRHHPAPLLGDGAVATPELALPGRHDHHARAAVVGIPLEGWAPLAGITECCACGRHARLLVFAPDLREPREVRPPDHIVERSGDRLLSLPELHEDAQALRIGTSPAGKPLPEI